ncbi:MAG TPA: hypothetical protein VG125_21795 [Pirellulales bacterium]|jgi:hypothetical protein|nr:hypothetical protein [Pirellulales bacterium]
MSAFLVRLALFAGICLSFVGSTPAAEQEAAARPLPSAGQGEILAALDQPTEFDFRERPLSDVIDYFKQKHEIEILLDSKALGDARVGTDTPITQKLKNISLRSALRLLLMQLDSTYVVGDGYLMITSKTQADSKLSCKIYPVHDLVALDSDFRPAPPKGDQRHDSPVVSEVVPIPSGFGGLGGLGRPDEAGDFTSLIEVITTTIAPATWDEVGGPGSIAPNRNTQVIAVSQTDDVQEEIVALLAALRRVRDEQSAAAQPVGSPVPPDPPEKKKRLQVRAYRLMRGTVNPGKSGWRPPVPLVGDSRPPRNAQASDRKQEAPGPSGEGGAAKEATPAKEAEPTKEAEPAKEAAPAASVTDKGAPTKPTDPKLEAWAEKIATLVPTMIDPQSWEPSGEGMIRAVGEGVVVRHTEEVQHRVARLMAELLPDYVPMGFNGPWGPWGPALSVHAAVRLRVGATGNWPHQAEPRPSGEEARVHEALLEKCDLAFKQLPLVDALNRLADARQVQLYIDRKALAKAGVGADTPLTCSVKKLNFKTALALLLDELDLTYLVRDEVLLITTKTEAENLLTTKVYPVFDLVVRPPNAPANRPALDFQSLIENITVNIAPTTWDEVGGPGAIQPFTNSAALVISQTTGVHQEVVDYLRALREAGAAQKQQRADANR